MTWVPLLSCVIIIYVPSFIGGSIINPLTPQIQWWQCTLCTNSLGPLTAPSLINDNWLFPWCLLALTNHKENVRQTSRRDQCTLLRVLAHTGREEGEMWSLRKALLAVPHTRQVTEWWTWTPRDSLSLLVLTRSPLLSLGRIAAMWDIMSVIPPLSTFQIPVCSEYTVGPFPPCRMCALHTLGICKCCNNKYGASNQNHQRHTDDNLKALIAHQFRISCKKWLWDYASHSSVCSGN